MLPHERTPVSAAGVSSEFAKGLVLLDLARPNTTSQLANSVVLGTRFPVAVARSDNGT
jgi:hypothetical protein